jgi:WWE domain/Poly(ADP-ribose) polymerase catalytic domain
LYSRGIYFAAKSVYSHSYAYQPAQRPLSSVAVDGRSIGKHDEREMFLTKLLVGNATELNRDESAQKAAEYRALTVPPTNSRTNLKYNTVTGHTGGSQVWIVYENGRAYPDYLVRYYRSKRDPTRTPWESKAEAVQASKLPPRALAATAPVATTEATTDSDMDDLETGQTGDHVWEYMDSAIWKPYSSHHQVSLESAFQYFLKHPDQKCADIRSNDWGYSIDFCTMLQTNVEHHTHTQRKVQRRLVQITI